MGEMSYSQRHRVIDGVQIINFCGILPIWRNEKIRTELRELNWLEAQLSETTLSVITMQSPCVQLKNESCTNDHLRCDLFKEALRL